MKTVSYETEGGQSVDTLNILTGHPLFVGVGSTTMRRLVDTAEELHASRGESIYTPQCFRRCLGFIAAGRVRVSKQALVVSILRAGDVFGAAALFNADSEYATTLTALTDCTVLLIPQIAVTLLLHDSPQFAENYVRYLSGRIQFLSARLNAVTAGSAERKLGQFLLTQADEKGTLRISATQLSARLGVGRASLYRAFDALEGAGAIERVGKEIHILDREKLM